MQRLRALVALMVALVMVAGAALPATAQDAEDPAVNRALDGALGGTWEAFVAYHGEPNEDGVWLEVPTTMGPADVVAAEFDGIVVEVMIEFPERDLEEEVTARDIFAAAAAFAPLDARCRLKAVETGFAEVTHLCTSTEIEKTLPATLYTDLGVVGEPGAYAIQSDPVDDDVYEIIVTLGHDLEGAEPVAEDDSADSGSTAGGSTAGGSTASGLDGVFGGTRESWDAAYGGPIASGVDDYGYPYADYASGYSMLSVSFNPETGVAEYILIEVASGDRELESVVFGVLANVTAYDSCSAIVLDVSDAMYECYSSAIASGLTQNDYDLAGSGNTVGTFMVLAGEVETGVVVIEISF